MEEVTDLYSRQDLPIKGVGRSVLLRKFSWDRIWILKGGFRTDSPSEEKVTCAINVVKLSQALGQLLPDEHTEFISNDFIQVSPTWFTSQRIEEPPINSLIVLLGRCLLSVTLQRWQVETSP